MTIDKTVSGLAGLLMAVLLGGCAASRLSPEEVIARAISAIAEVQTYRVDLTTIYSEGDETNQSEGRMEFVSPDRLHAMVQSGDANEVIIIGQEYYYRALEGTEWRLRELPVTRHNAAVAMTEELESLIDLVALSDEDVDGVACFHYRGRVDMDARVDEQIAGLDLSRPDYDVVKETLEYQRQWRNETEFWIAKEGFLLRQVKVKQEREVEDVSVNVTYRFYDFNAPIEIEPPPDEDVVSERQEAVDLVATSVSSVGGDDPAHQRISYQIAVSNRGSELAGDVRVYVDTEATDEGRQTLEAEPTRRPVDLASTEHETYVVSWEYDMTSASKQELVSLLKDSVFGVEWTDSEGRRHEKTILEGGGTE